MKYNPEKHYRRSIRLKNYDYSSDGGYFITICTQNRECVFEQFSVLKNIVDAQWRNIPDRFKNVSLDEYIIMPNHIHGIISISNETRPVGATLAVAQYNNPVNPDADPVVQSPLQITKHIQEDNRAGVNPAPTTIGTVIGQFKSLCAHEWLGYIKKQNINAAGKFWQRNYYEHVIRNDESLRKIRQYIIDNPANWERDRNNAVLVDLSELS